LVLGEWFFTNLSQMSSRAKEHKVLPYPTQ
jgi:hypothetical protein